LSIAQKTLFWRICVKPFFSLFKSRRLFALKCVKSICSFPWKTFYASSIFLLSLIIIYFFSRFFISKIINCINHARLLIIFSGSKLNFSHKLFISVLDWCTSLRLPSHAFIKVFLIFNPPLIFLFLRGCFFLKSF
jgi:hypothetical protein